jgi:hypothetical protein
MSNLSSWANKTYKETITINGMKGIRGTKAVLTTTRPDTRYRNDGTVQIIITPSEISTTLVLMLTNLLLDGEHTRLASHTKKVQVYSASPWLVRTPDPPPAFTQTLYHHGLP